MKIAIVHEMLIKLWWAEKVLKCLLKNFKNADIYTLIYDEKKVWKVFKKNHIKKEVFSLPSQKVYNLTQNQRFSLLLMKKSIERFNFDNYDIVICSSSWFAHWVKIWNNTRLIVYYHSPSRYLWDWTNEYKKDIWWNNKIKWLILNYIFLKLRLWDFKVSQNKKINIANSKNTQKRIRKYYKKDSILLYPPVETKRFQTKVNKNLYNKYYQKYKIKENNYFIIISTLTEFKKIDIAIKAFNKLKKENLFIIWDGDYKSNLQNLIKWKNIFMLWSKYKNELVCLVQNSKWLIFPWEEDFWIVPIEVMASWKPVFALNKWWLKETIIKWKTWDFFEQKNWSDFVKKFKTFNQNIKNWKYKKEDCIKQANKYSEKEFIKKFKLIINSNVSWL